MIHLFINPNRHRKQRRRKDHDNLKRVCRLHYFGLLLLWTWHLASCTVPGGNQKIPQIQLTIQNALPVRRESVPIIFSLAELKQVAPDFSFDAYLVVTGEPPVEIHSQADDTDYDGQKDELVFVIDLEPQETKQVSIRYSPNNEMAVTLGFAKRTRAGIFPELKGIAALESEWVAYLLEASGSIHAYGKKTKGLFLDRWVHQIATPSSSTEAPMIPLTTTVGPIGEGGFGLWNAANKELISLNRGTDYTRVIADGPVRSVVQRIIPDLPLGSNGSVSLTATFSIYAGHRWGENRIQVQGLDDHHRIAIGIPNRGMAPAKSEADGWLWMWDDQPQTLSPSPVGFGIIYPAAQFDAFSDVSVGRGSEGTHAALIAPDENNEVAYRFVSVWGEGEVGIQTKEAFSQYVQVTATEIQTPPAIKFLPQTSEAPKD